MGVRVNVHMSKITCTPIKVGIDTYATQINCCTVVAKGFLKLPNLHMLIKQKSPSFNRNLLLRTFGEFPIYSVSNKGKSTIPPLFNGPEVLSSASDNAKLLAEKFRRDSNFDDSSISMPVFPSKIDLKLHNITITPKMVKSINEP